MKAKNSRQGSTKTYWTLYIFTNVWQSYKDKSAREREKQREHTKIYKLVHHTQLLKNPSAAWCSNKSTDNFACLLFLSPFAMQIKVNQSLWLIQRQANSWRKSQTSHTSNTTRIIIFLQFLLYGTADRYKNCAMVRGEISKSPKNKECHPLLPLITENLMVPMAASLMILHVNLLLLLHKNKNKLLLLQGKEFHILSHWRLQVLTTLNQF